MLRRLATHLWGSYPGPIVLAGIAAIVLIPSAGVLAFRVTETGGARIPANVSVGGVQVGGMSVTDARRAIHTHADPDLAAFTITSPTLAAPVRFSTARLDPTPAIEPAIQRAKRPRSVWGRLRTQLGLGREREVDLRYRLAPRSLRAVLRDLEQQVNRRPRPASVRANGRIRVAADRPGRRVQRDVLAARLRRLQPVIELPVSRVPAPVTTTTARRIAARARKTIAGGVVVAGGGRQARLSRETLRDALRFPVRDGTLGIELDAGVLQRALSRPYSDLIRPPRSAEFRISGERVRVASSRTGRELHIAPIAAAILRDPPSGKVRVRFRTREPRRTTKEARAMGIRRQVSSFTTNYACCAPRVTNIRLGAQKLDGQIIPAGGHFSLNEALGERTAERGFVAAPQINAGQLEDAVGGGVSQIATTIFNAAWFAGLEVETHTPHQFYISRYPLGREATVSWGGPELIFVNDWPAAVLISATTTDTSITVSFYSNPLGRRVETNTVELPGSGGAPAARYSRTVFRGDEVRREDSYTWAYDPAPN